MLKIPVYLQILFDVNLNFIEQFDFLEIFCYFGGINLSEKCVNVSCCVVLVSNQQWEKWKSAVMATFQHCTSTDDEPQLAQCPEGLDSWCFYQRTLARGDTPPSHTEKVSCYLAKDVAEHLKEVYIRLSEEELLPSCLEGKTK